jgi:hypothetical protein
VNPPDPDPQYWLLYLEAPYMIQYLFYRAEDEGGGFSQNLEIVPETEREFIAR